eukprot:COSAG06_NODE_15507_length_1066_cov_1.109617_1_plen_67_part_00
MTTVAVVLFVLTAAARAANADAGDHLEDFFFGDRIEMAQKLVPPELMARFGGATPCKRARLHGVGG